MPAIADVIIPPENLLRCAQGTLAMVFDLPAKKWRLTMPINAREQVAFGTASFTGPDGEPPPWRSSARASRRRRLARSRKPAPPVAAQRPSPAVTALLKETTMPEKKDPRVEAAKQVLRALDIDEGRIDRGAAALATLMSPAAPVAVEPWNDPAIADNPQERMTRFREHKAKLEAEAGGKPALPENAPADFASWSPEQRLSWYRSNVSHKPETRDPIKESEQLVKIGAEAREQQQRWELRDRLREEWARTGQRPKGIEEAEAACR